jgi:hypothetical protein
MEEDCLMEEDHLTEEDCLMEEDHLTEEDCLMEEDHLTEEDHLHLSHCHQLQLFLEDGEISWSETLPSYSLGIGPKQKNSSPNGNYMKG